MNWAQTFRTAFSAIVGHRLRSILTVLGILIGIASVALSVGLAQGTASEVQKQITSLGTNVLTISAGSASSGGVRGGAGSARTLTTGDATALTDRDVAPDIAAVAPVMQSSSVLSEGSANWTTTVIGTTDKWTDVRARTLEAGRFLTPDDVTQASPVIVLGPDTAAELFGNAEVHLVVHQPQADRRNLAREILALDAVKLLHAHLHQHRHVEHQLAVIALHLHDFQFEPPQLAVRDDQKIPTPARRIEKG